MGTSIAPVDAPKLLAPFLQALPPAAVSSEPATGILPLLSPVLRQRVQAFGGSSNDPWLRWLCYDTGKAARLGDIARGGALEAHPVSGEVEVDWDLDAETRYRRVDSETLQALVALTGLGIAFQLVYCVGDAEGGGDGWRIGEVTITEKPSPFSIFGGASSTAEAGRQFKDGPSARAPTPKTNGRATQKDSPADNAGAEEDEDDGYWAQYDATPAQTPGLNRPRPATKPQPNGYQTASAEDDYYSQYDTVQPAMDNHDPDEAAALEQAAPPLGFTQATDTQDPTARGVQTHTQGSGPISSLGIFDGPSSSDRDTRRPMDIAHPRPDSSAGSSGSHTVATLEATAGKQEQNEFGVKQHVARSIRSLYLLSKASGIDREEFEVLVKTELDILGMIEDQEL